MTTSRLRSRALLSSALVAIAFGSSGAWGQITTVSTSTSTAVNDPAANSSVTITSTGSISGAPTTAPAITVGDTSTVSNLGTVNAGAGNPAITFGNGGTLNQGNSTTQPTGAITGNIIMNADSGNGTSTINNWGTTNGIVGNITTAGSANFNNNGLLTGNFTETTISGSTVKIVNGNGSGLTGTITGNITTADTTNITNNSSSSITGTITETTPTSGTGSLTITNYGTITGAITETAGSTAGTVSINNNTGATYTGVLAIADPTTFTNAGTATVTGTINSSLSTATATTLTNTGTLNIGTASVPGTLVVNGNFSNTGTLNTFLTSATPLTATGTGTLNGTVNITTGTTVFTNGTAYNVVVANGGLSGSPTININSTAVATNGVVAVSPFISLTNDGVSGDALEVTATRTAYATALTNAGTATPNQIAVAGGFQGLVATAAATPGTSDTLPASAQALVGGVDALTTVAAAEKFFDQISPQGYGAYVTALQDQGDLFSRQINMRLDTLGDQNTAHGPWLTAYYQRGKASGTYSSSENITGFQAGYDLGNDHIRGGISAGYSSAKLTYNVGNLSGNDNSFQLGAYAGFTSHHFIADLQLDYINGALTSTKNMTVGTLAFAANASTNANVFKAVGVFGYDFGGENNRIQPFVGFDVSKGHFKGFTESGAGAADLTVGELKADRSDLLVGLDYTRKTGKIRPYLHAAYRYNLQNPNTVINAQFNGDKASVVSAGSTTLAPTADTPFSVTDVVPSRSEEDVNAGITLPLDDDGSYFAVGYQGIIRSGLTSHGVNLSLFVSF